MCVCVGERDLMINKEMGVPQIDFAVHKDRDHVLHDARRWLTGALP